MNISQQFKELRKCKGIKQKTLAKSVDITPVMLNMFENEKANVSLKTLKRLCDNMNCQLIIINK